MLKLSIKRFFSLAVALIAAPWLCGAQQSGDPVLFTVDGQPVHQSEFVYIYGKTNGDRASFSEKSLKEYLDLYTKFKLKVAKAREMQLDTVQELNRELDGYRRQLADSYLIDKEVTERLIEEAYERVKEDVDISHILVAVPADAGPEAEEAAQEKVREAMKRIEGGEAFEKVARELSDDKSAQNNGGRIGFVTALFPNGFYGLEKAAYAAKAGQLTGPVRTDAGFHALMVHERRPARGEIEAAHILIRIAEDQNDAQAKTRIDSVYQALEGGADFESLAKALSQDSRSASSGGNIGFFGINRYTREFEDAAFALKEDGAYTKPVKTNVGWHIVKRISRRGIQPYSIERGRLENAVKKDNRFEQAKLSMIARIKEDAPLKEYAAVLDDFTQSLTDTFLTFRWKAPEEKSEALLLKFGEAYEVTLGDFTDYLGRTSRQRIRMSRNTEVPAAVQELYAGFVDEQAMRYEEQMLETKYPDFKSLMREYEEGILLFEATKQVVWDRAAKDTLGLEAFHEKNQKKYRWGERAETSIYRISKDLRGKMDEIRAFISTHSPEEVLAKYNTADEEMLVRHEAKRLEKKIYPAFKQMEWKTGALSQSEEDPQSGIFTVVKIERLIPPTEKTLDEARGYVVADYQDYLELDWVESLRKEYEVKVNEKVLKSLIRSKE